MSKLSYSQLLTACEPGGASALSIVTELAPAGGPHAAVAAAPRGRDTAAAGYEIRLIDGQPAVTVIIDQNQSQLRRVEAAILQGIRDEHPVLSRVPHVQVTYDDDNVVFTDLDLPQRVFDHHIRAGTVDGEPVSAHPRYRAACDSSPGNARALLEFSPGSLAFGSSHSTGTTQLVRYRGVLAGEVIGVLTDQRDLASREAKRLQNPEAVSCSRIIRTQVLGFAALRQLRFDAGPAGDAACRTLLAAYALAGLARSNAELSIRSNCDLVEAGPAAVKLDARDGDFVALDPPSIEAADEMLERAIEEARREADIDWRGQVFRVVGDQAGYAAAVAEAEHGQGGEPARRPSWRTHLIDGRGFGGRG